MNDPFAGLKALQPPPNRIYSTVRGVSSEVPQGSERLAELLGAVCQRNHYGEHMLVRQWFAEPELTNLHPAALRLIEPNAPEEACDPSQWLFLDTETTGLSGGSGTYAFLIGIAWWDVAGLQVEQFFMREHNEEHSVLLALSERMEERRVLVTFNGKSFDWPLLETRYRMTRSISARPPCAHLDLLHPSRHVWRPRLNSLRLVELERHVLGWDRGEDILSEMIPQSYFDFVRGADPGPLVPVFRHNQMDLRGLAGLAVKMLTILGQPNSEPGDSLELYGISRLFDHRGESAQARNLYARALKHGLPEGIEHSARYRLARLAKRERDFPLAHSLWEKLRGNSREGFRAYEELAMHYEHRVRDLPKAVAVNREALGELRKARRLQVLAPAAYVRWEERFTRRIERLRKKMARLPLASETVADLQLTPRGADKP